MILQNRHGFTLIEILLVLGLMSIVLIMIPIFDLSSFKKDSKQDEINIFIQDLQKVRSAAMNNISGQDHGVFESLTGNVSQEREIVFKDETNTLYNATVTINHEGGIDW
ncbi:MAG: type II secretion system protein [Candidatus Paceibacterota bacterium]